MRAAELRRAGWSSARAARGALWLLLIPAVLQLPAQVGVVSRRWEVIRQWDDPDEQLQLTVAGIDIALILEADRRLHADARVVVITEGRDPRRSEYLAFHRARYLLTPRPVWWLAPALPDETWESRWWTPNPLTPASIAGFVRDHRITHGLVFGQSVAVDSGALLLRGRGGRLVGFETGAAAQLAGVSRGESWARRPVLLRLAAGLCAVFALGSGVLLSLTRGSRRFTLPELGAGAWWLGSLLLTVGMFWLDRCRVPLRHQLAGLSLLAAAALIAGLVRRFAPGLRSSPQPAGEDAPANPVPGTLPWGGRRVLVAPIALLCANIAFVAILAIGQPLEAWDSWAQWAGKARAIFRAGGIGTAAVADATRLDPHPHYPLLVPLRETWLFGSLGAPDDRWLGCLTLLDYVGLLVLAWGLMRISRVPEAFAWVAVTVLAAVYTLAACAGMALADTTLALFAMAGVAHLVRWTRSAARSDLLLGGLAAGALGWVKSEGAVLTAVMIVAAAFLRLPMVRKSACITAIAASFCVTTWPWWFALGDLPRTAVDFAPLNLANLAAGIDRIPTILLISVRVLGDRLLGWVWPMAALVFLARHSRRFDGAPVDDGVISLLARVAWLYAVVMAGTYLLSTYRPLSAHVMNSYFRLAAQVTPLLVVWLAARCTGPEER